MLFLFILFRVFFQSSNLRKNQEINESEFYIEEPKLEKHFTFIKKNIPFHFSHIVSLISVKNNSEINIDLSKFNNFKDAQDALAKRSAYYITDSIIKDNEILSNENIIQHINNALIARKEYPWCASLSLDQFNEYVLPYRIGQEPLTFWRKFFYNRYKSLADSCKLNNVSEKELCTLINDDLKKQVSYSSSCSVFPGQFSFDKILQMKCANCEGMAHIAIWAMRSVGLAVAKDIAPYWGSYNSGHVWNVLITPEKKIPFGGCGDNPGEMPLFYRAPKIFRTVYSFNPNPILEYASRKQAIPLLFKELHTKDVTNEYYETFNVKAKLEQKKPKGNNCAFLCVYNNNRWVPVEWAKIRIFSSNVTFSNMSGEILYMPAYFHNERAIQAGYPFYIDNSGEKKTFKPDYSNKIKIDNVWDYSYWKGNITEKDKKYTLFLWDGSWMRISSATPKAVTGNQVPERIDRIHDWINKKQANSPEYILTFEDVPSNGLYKLGKNSRPFWIDKNQIVMCTSTPDEKYVFKELKNE